MAFSATGPITKLDVQQGDTVKAGQVLAQLDTRQLDLQLVQAEANLTAAQAKLNQLKTPSASDIAAAQANVEQAQADLYEVVYPVGWESYGLAPPQCNPCDHQHNGIDFTDYHDHVLDSIPASPGHGEYTPLWHVWVIMPVYTGVASHDNAVSAAYAAHLPATSEDAAESLTHLTLADGSPVATQIDTHFYFVCAVVSDHAAH